MTDDIIRRVSTDTVLAFAALAAVLVAIPGPAVILVLKSAMLRGRGSAIVTALGVLTADLIWATASIAGLTALLVSSQLVFDAVRIAGAAYLIYLGIRLMRTREFQPTAADGALKERGSVTSRRAFVEGLLSDLSNPKTVLVYASVIPQFLTVSSSASDAFVLGVVFALAGFLSLLVYALVFGAAGTLIRNGRIARNVLRGGGGVLSLFGLGLLIHRPAH
ncbi:LysE family translocator [Amycolatopsis taiwanensis]|uniref:LysE family translocator n=1 Tax=Amycolatopsis taiwanensis TaxID=342230 RepID=UPI0004B5D706|nr:LysE family translocator [Amycolatopsis taiwanensis]